MSSVSEIPTTPSADMPSISSFPDNCFSLDVDTNLPSKPSPDTSTDAFTVYFPFARSFAAESRFDSLIIVGVSLNVFAVARRTFPPLPIMAFFTATAATMTTTAVPPAIAMPLIQFFFFGASTGV